MYWEIWGFGELRIGWFEDFDGLRTLRIWKFENFVIWWFKDSRVFEKLVTEDLVICGVSGFDDFMISSIWWFENLRIPAFLRIWRLRILIVRGVWEIEKLRIFEDLVIWRLKIRLFEDFGDLWNFLDLMMSSIWRFNDSKI